MYSESIHMIVVQEENTARVSNPTNITLFFSLGVYRLKQCSQKDDSDLGSYLWSLNANENLISHCLISSSWPKLGLNLLLAHVLNHYDVITLSNKVNWYLCALFNIPYILSTFFKIPSKTMCDLSGSSNLKSTSLPWVVWHLCGT